MLSFSVFKLLNAVSLPLKDCFSQLFSKTSPGRGGGSSTYPPPGIDVGDVHQGVILLQGLVFVEHFHLAQGKVSPPQHRGRGTASPPPEPLRGHRGFAVPRCLSQSRGLPGLAMTEQIQSLHATRHKGRILPQRPPPAGDAKPGLHEAEP